MQLLLNYYLINAIPVHRFWITLIYMTPVFIAVAYI